MFFNGPRIRQNYLCIFYCVIIKKKQIPLQFHKYTKMRMEVSFFYLLKKMRMEESTDSIKIIVTLHLHTCQSIHFLFLCSTIDFH